MSAQAAVYGALLAALRGAADFGGALNGVFEGPAVKATPPYAELGELLASDWGTKDIAGRELRTVVTIRDLAEGPGRIHALVSACEDAVAGLPRDLGGWRVVSLVGVRSRVVRQGPGKWAAVVEHRLRLLATGEM